MYHLDSEGFRIRFFSFYMIFLGNIDKKGDETAELWLYMYLLPKNLYWSIVN